MTTQQTTWQEYTGSDEQIAEINNAENGVLYRFKDGKESEPYYHITSIKFTHYWIIPADPLREMKIRWAITGQPVWIRTNPFDWDVSVPSHYATTTPDWNIPNAEYSFTAFEE